VAVRHRGARARVPGRHRTGMASPHRRAGPHDRHEPFRDDVLSARGPSCLARDPRARHAEPLRHLRMVRRAQGRSRGARRARLLVLALRGRGVGRRLHSCLRDRTMSKPAVQVIAAVIPRERSQVTSDFVALTKPRVLLMVLATTIVGYFVALSGPADYVRVTHLLIGTLLAAGGTLALNQYLERDLDARMGRTRRRPLPAGRLQPLEALLFGGALTLVGAAYLAALLSPLVASITMVTTILYVFAYTPLKLRSPLCTLVGAVPGAL